MGLCTAGPATSHVKLQTLPDPYSAIEVDKPQLRRLLEPRTVAGRPNVRLCVARHDNDNVGGADVPVDDTRLLFLWGKVER